MAQNKISRRSFLRGVGASATLAAASCMAPSAAACDLSSLWKMDLQILASSDTHGKFDPWDYTANKEDASGSVAQQATAIRELRTPYTLVVDAGDTIQGNAADHEKAVRLLREGKLILMENADVRTLPGRAITTADLAGL